MNSSAKCRLRHADVIALSIFALTSIALAATSYVLSKNNSFSIISTGIFFFFGAFATKIAQDSDIVISYSKWIYSLTIYSVLCYLIFIVFWYNPLSTLGDLRIPAQIPGYQDSNYYDYLAEWASESPYSEWPSIIGSTWLSHGIVSYLGLIYKYLGTSQFNYLFINIAISYASVIFLQGIFWRYKCDIAIPALFSPFVLYYNITPGKEVLTNFTCYAFLFVFYRIWTLQNGVYRNYFCFAIAWLIALSVIRVNAALMALASVIAYSMACAKNKLKILIYATSILISIFILFYITGVIELIEVILDFNSHMSQLDNRLEGAEAGGLKHYLANSLTSNNAFVHLLLGPIRMVIWLVAPFPFLNLFELLSAIFYGNHYDTFRAGEALCRSISSVLMVLILLRIIGSYLTRNYTHAGEDERYIFFIAACFIFILSTTNFVEGARYRTIVEPLLIAWFFVSQKQRSRAYYQ